MRFFFFFIAYKFSLIEERSFKQLCSPLASSTQQWSKVILWNGIYTEGSCGFWELWVLRSEEMTFSDWMYHTRALLKKHVNYASSSLIVNFFKGVKKNHQPRIRKQFITIQKNSSVSSPLQHFAVTVLCQFLFSHFPIFILFFVQNYLQITYWIPYQNGPRGEVKENICFQVLLSLMAPV